MAWRSSPISQKPGKKEGLGLLQTDPRDRVEEAPLEKSAGEPGVEHRQGQAEEEHVVERVVDVGHGQVPDPSSTAAGEVSGEPLGEGPQVGAEEGVGGVEEAVLGAEAASGEPHHPRPRRQRVRRVRPRPRHLLPAPSTGGAAAAAATRWLLLLRLWRSPAAAHIEKDQILGQILLIALFPASTICL